MKHAMGRSSDLAATYAIIQTGGKQYRVAPGETIDVEFLPVPPGDEVRFEQVLLVAGETGLSVGAPTVPGASVTANVVAQERGDKIIVFRYKNKTRYRRKTGHRQDLTRLQIKEIIA